MLRRSLLLWQFQLVRSVRADDLAAQLGPQDIMLGDKISERTMQWFAWPGMPHRQVAEAIEQIPERQRSIHTIFGRKDSVLDIALDYDACYPTDLFPKGIPAVLQYITNQAKTLCDKLDAHCAAAGETIVRRVVFHSPNNSKLSLHLHAQLQGAAFQNHAALREWLDPLAQQVPQLDMGMYRPYGSLRLYSSVKHDRRMPLKLLNTVRCIGFGTAQTTPSTVDLIEASLITVSAERAAQSRLIVASKAQPASQSTFETALDPARCFDFLQYALAKVPASFADDYRQWITLGIQLNGLGQSSKVAAAHPSKDVDALAFEAWDTFSQRSPKYKSGICREKWRSFRKKSDDQYDRVIFWLQKHCDERQGVS